MDIHDYSIQISLFWSFICKSQKCRNFESISLIFPTQHFLAISFSSFKKENPHTHTLHTHTLSTATQPHTRTHTHTITKIIAVRRNNFTMNNIKFKIFTFVVFSLPFFREEFGRLHCWVWRWPSGWSGRAVPVETAAMLDPVGSLVHPPPPPAWRTCSSCIGDARVRVWRETGWHHPTLHRRAVLLLLLYPTASSAAAPSPAEKVSFSKFSVYSTAELNQFPFLLLCFCGGLK